METSRFSLNPPSDAGEAAPAFSWNASSGPLRRSIGKETSGWDWAGEGSFLPTWFLPNHQVLPSVP